MLLYLGRLFVHGPPELLGVITASLHSYLFDNYTYSWLASLRQDLIWISARCPQFESFKELSLMEILQSIDFCMMLSSNSWSKHVKVVFENILDDWKFSPELHPNKFSFPPPPPPLPVGPPAAPSSPPPLPPPPPVAVTTFPCLQCDRVCFSARQLSGHVSTGHKVLHPIQKYVGNTSVCRKCFFCFSNRPRLIKHLRTGSLVCLCFTHPSFPLFPFLRLKLR